MDTIRLEKFVEALHDPATGLTYPALTGVRKQSVEDVERLFGEGVIKFMQDHEYEPEMKFLRTVRNWRQAIDERACLLLFVYNIARNFLSSLLKTLFLGIVLVILISAL